MILKQYYLNCLAHASYLIADKKSGTAVVVNPQRDIDQYVADAEAEGLKIKHVLLTHLHADFLAGHLEFREKFGSSIHLGARAETEFDFVAMKDGGVLELGEQVKLGFLETPGHTPEGVTILVYDRSRDEKTPHAALTGDTLFIGDVGRPDLMASIGITARELAGQLYRSLKEKIMTLPDETLVYPAHGAGSMCGKNLSTDTVSTIGSQRKFNYALQPMSEEEFVKLVTADQPQQPRYFSYNAMLNRQERGTLDKALKLSLNPLSLDEVLAARSADATLLDARSPEEFAQIHIKGSINVGLDGKYATWAGTIIDHNKPIVIIAPDGREEESAVRLGRIGFDHVAGHLKGGIETVRGREDLLGGWNRMTPADLARAMASADPPVVVDVRGPGERENSCIEGSLHVPLNQLQERMDEIPRDKKLAVYCGGGYRSAIAGSLLQSRGYEQLTDLIGGFAAWEKEQKTKAV